MAVKVKQVGKDWWLYIDWKGQRRARKVGTKKAAEMARIQIEARLASGGPIFVDPAPSVPTFKVVAEEWLPRYAKLRSLRDSTIENYESFVRLHLIPYFGTDSIASITADRVEDFITVKRSPGGSVRKKKALADGSVKVALPTLRSILDYAVRRKWLPTNPLRGEKLWKAAPKSLAPDPFNTEELRAIVSAAESLSPQFGLLIRAWAQSGMRSGEIRSLQFDDFDPKTGKVSISRTRTHKRVGPPKTLQSVRAASLTFPTLEDTHSWHPTVTSSAILARVGAIVALSGDFPLFPNPQGRPYDETELHGLWRRAIHRAKVRYRSPETLRHSLVSVLLSRGAPILMVSKQTGHSPMIMLQHYASWLPQDHPIPAQANPLIQGVKPGESMV